MTTEFNPGGAADINEAVKLRYEQNDDTNAFTDAEKSKLSGIEAAADVTDATNVAAAGAIMDADFSSNGMMTRTASGTYASRSISSGTGITVTNGNGQSGNPTIALSANTQTALGLANSASQPGHTHTANNITDFSEAVDDRVAVLLVEGTGIDLTYNDGAGTLTIATTGGGGGDSWGDPVDADIIPDADGTRDIGSSANRFAEGHFDALEVGGYNVVTENTGSLSEKSTSVDNDMLVGFNSESSNAAVYFKRSTIRAGLVANTVTITAGTGLTGGGDLSTNRTISLSSNTSSALALANTSVQPARTISAGTGLTGGGSLAANRTISLDSSTTTSLGKADTAVQPARSVSAGTGLTGGGDLSANRTIALDSSSIASLAKADTSVQSVTTGVSGADAISNAITLTTAEYAAIGTKNSATLYFITDAT